MPLRKACTVIPARNGSQFPNGAPRGNYIPEFWLETGYGFPNRPLTENASRNPHSKRDALSQSRPYGKLRPTLKGKTGTQFPGGSSKTKLRWNSSWMDWLMPQIGTISPQVIEGLGCPSSYRWRSRKRKARRIQGRTATCLSSLSTAVLALPSERPWPPWSKTCISHATPSSAMRCANG